jgi:hypothetical protein
VVGKVVGLREQLCGTVDDSQLYFSQPVG